MAGRGYPDRDTAGGPARHLPVLLDQVVEVLSPRDGGIYIDGTFGGGGYARALLESADCRVLGIDRDREAIAAGAALRAASGDRLTLVEARFSNLDRIAEETGFADANGVALDIGVSSMQIDTAGRGFSFSQDGPLDMRMGGDGPDAADVVNTLPESELARIIRTLGEERHARRVARAIVAARGRAPIVTTGRLAEIVSAHVPRARDGIHPATRTFQALRIFVNSELDELADGLVAAERALAPGGRLAVVAFHSLEDRIVKRFLAERSATSAGTSRHLPEGTAKAPTFTLLKRRPLTPDDAEVAANPRARSARLRGAERTEAPARPVDRVALGVPELPDLPAASRRLQ